MAVGALLQAPYQIDGVERDLTDRFGIEGYVVQVDLGAAAGKSVPSVPPAGRSSIKRTRNRSSTTRS